VTRTASETLRDAISALSAATANANENHSFIYSVQHGENGMALFGRDEEGQIVPGYKGPLSTYSEWHALAIGFYHGFSEDKEIPKQVMSGNADVKYEPHMAKIGFPIGVVTKYVVLIGLAKAFGAI